jgi:hypothetical protein
MGDIGKKISDKSKKFKNIRSDNFIKTNNEINKIERVFY